MRIKIFDALFDDEVCNLVYMQDISQVMREGDIEMAQRVNECISKQLRVPQQIITQLIGQLVKGNCTEEQRETLKGIQISTRLM